MKLSEYQRSRSFFDLGERSLRFQSQMFDFGLYTQVSDSGPHCPLVRIVLEGKNSFLITEEIWYKLLEIKL